MSNKRRRRGGNRTPSQISTYGRRAPVRRDTGAITDRGAYAPDEYDLPDLPSDLIPEVNEAARRVLQKLIAEAAVDDNIVHVRSKHSGEVEAIIMSAKAFADYQKCMDMITEMSDGARRIGDLDS